MGSLLQLLWRWGRPETVAEEVSIEMNLMIMIVNRPELALIRGCVRARRLGRPGCAPRTAPTARLPPARHSQVRCVSFIDFGRHLWELLPLSSSL